MMIHMKHTHTIALDITPTHLVIAHMIDNESNDTIATMSFNMNERVDRLKLANLCELCPCTMSDAYANVIDSLIDND